MASSMSVLVFVVLVMATMGELTAPGSAGGGSAGGELMPPGGGSAPILLEAAAPAVVIEGSKLTAPGPAGGSGGLGQLMPAPASSGGIVAGGGELTAPGPPAGGSSAGELIMPLAAASSGGGAGKQLTAPGPATGGGEGELMTPPAGSGSASAAGGSTGGKQSELTTTPASAASLLLPQELALLDLGGNCSFGCAKCLLENIGSCLVVGLTCPDPLAVVKCFIGKFIIIKNCFGTDDDDLTVAAVSVAGGSAADVEAEPTTISSAASEGELMPGSPAAAAATAGVSCSDDCKRCLLDSFASCLVEGVICGNLFGFVKCFVEEFVIIEECFDTKRT